MRGHIKVRDQEALIANSEGCTRRADPGSIYCSLCRPAKMTAQERELTRTLALDDPSCQQFEIKLTPEVILVLVNPFTPTLLHTESIIDSTNQCNEGETAFNTF